MLIFCASAISTFAAGPFRRLRPASSSRVGTGRRSGWFPKDGKGAVYHLPVGGNQISGCVVRVIRFNAKQDRGHRRFKVPASNLPAGRDIYPVRVVLLAWSDACGRVPISRKFQGADR